MTDFTPTKFRIWYKHQVGTDIPPYTQGVDIPEVGTKILEGIYRAFLHAFDNKMIPDYANTGGVVYLDEDGEWVDWDPDDRS